MAWKKGKRDANEKEIIKHLKSFEGVVLESLTNQVLDYLIDYQTFGTGIMEIKGEKTTWKRGQIEFISRWPGPIFIIKTVEQATDMLIYPNASMVSSLQRERFKVLLQEDKRENFPAKFIENVLLGK